VIFHFCNCKNVVIADPVSCSVTDKCSWISLINNGSYLNYGAPNIGQGCQSIKKKHLLIHHTESEFEIEICKLSSWLGVRRYFHTNEVLFYSFL
jgi:hypothetical protein